VAKRVLARQLRTAYGGLFELNTKAYELTVDEVRGKLASLTGKDEAVVKNMAATFATLAKEADFSSAPPLPTPAAVAEARQNDVESPALSPQQPVAGALAFSHTIYINLPATRDIAVYDAIFKSLRENLL